MPLRSHNRICLFSFCYSPIDGFLSRNNLFVLCHVAASIVMLRYFYFFESRFVVDDVSLREIRVVLPMHSLIEVMVRPQEWLHELLEISSIVKTLESWRNYTVVYKLSVGF